MRAAWVLPILLVQAPPILFLRAADLQANGGAFAPLVATAFAQGFGRPLSGALCTALDLTTKGQELPVEQLSAADGDTKRSFSVSRHRGTLDIVVSRRTARDLVVFRVSAEGLLVKAIGVRDGGAMEAMTPAAAAPEFEKERAWWLGDPAAGGKAPPDRDRRKLE